MLLISNQHCNFIILLIAFCNTAKYRRSHANKVSVVVDIVYTNCFTQSGFSIATQHCHPYIVIIATLKLISVAEPGSSVGSPSQFGRGLARQRS